MSESGKCDRSGFQNIGPVRDLKRHLRVLLDQQNSRTSLVQCPEGRRIFARMTVEENLQMGAYTRPSSELAQNLEKVYELFPRLKERQKQVGGTLSGGEQQMLAMGRAMMSQPKLLMLDEPSMGLAPLLVEQIFGIIQSLHKAGSTILLV